MKMVIKNKNSRTAHLIQNLARKGTICGSPQWTIALACSLIIFLAALNCLHPKAEAGTEGCTYYVSTNGVDNHSGTSEAQAWASFSHALGQLHAGDTLCLVDGTYNQSLTISMSGEASNPITIQALHDNEVILKNSGTSIRVSDSNYITIQGITIQGGSQGVYVIGSNHIT